MMVWRKWAKGSGKVMRMVSRAMRGESEIGAPGRAHA